ncbi:MAG: SUMF1/EgtB/PvdO family nonheme iron enzyme [Syntrophobacteraceae bacterium]|nr:SUMF1/EgtB/PvdO family nonheme iron enzyme [Syntrophobacteraceae bacterium]
MDEGCFHDAAHAETLLRDCGAAWEIRKVSFDDPRTLRDLASHFGESWWQEVILLLLALEEEPSIFTPFIREVVRLPAFAASRDLVERCLDDAARTSPQAFVELLRPAAGTTAASGWRRFLPPAFQKLLGRPLVEPDPDLWERQLVALRVLERLDERALETLLPQLAAHPSPDIRRWAAERGVRSRQDVVYAERGGYELVRLPSEAEWEYACRAGTTTRYHTGDTEEDLGRAGWYQGNSGGKLHPVGEMESNGFGLYDMHGNVWEWVEDDWNGSYAAAGRPDDGRPWIDALRGSYRVMRGGGWRGRVAAAFCRSARRSLSAPGLRSPGVGFRLSRSVALEPLDFGPGFWLLVSDSGIW